MPIEERISNGSASNHSPEKMESVITYKRRKHARSCSDGCLLEDGAFDDRVRHLSVKNMKESHDVPFSNNVNEAAGQPRIEQPIVVEFMNESLCGYWKTVLEHILKSPNLSEGGIRSCICDALASRHFGFTRNSKMHDAIKKAAQGKERVYQNGDMDNHLSESTNEAQASDSYGNAAVGHEKVISDGQMAANGEANGHAITEQCQSVFLDVIVSDKFFSLCNFLCGNFHGIHVDSIFDFGTINSRMKNGHYEQSSELFASDIQQVWKKFEKIGEEMVCIARSLSNISQSSYQKRVGNLMGGAGGEGKDKEIVGPELRDSAFVDSSKQFPSDELNLPAKPEQTEACGLQKLCTCRQCGTAEADGERRLICDGCEAMYHITCINPPLEEVPHRSWYCAACSENGKNSREPGLIHNPGDCSHRNCVVCKRLKESVKTRELSDDSEETSDGSSTEANRQIRGHTSSRVCKLCKMGEQENMKFKICEHEHCPYKYYHAMCLRDKQMACPHSRFYCPSCLCRGCLFDKDDDKIVLCDGCDEAYHIYCMVPPLTSIPKGNWYCTFCTIEIRARRRMRLKFDDAGVKKQRKGNQRRENGAAGSVDMLLSAAEKLSSEEQPAAAIARRKNR